MKTSQNGIDLICSFEGFSAKPYLDVNGIPTIAYGFTHYADGTKVTMQDSEIGEGYAKGILAQLLTQFEHGINSLVTSPINQNQFDSLISFAYNVGLGSLKSSTLLQEVNANPMNADISVQFQRWCHGEGGIIISGLQRRRKAEANLYFTPINA